MLCKGALFIIAVCVYPPSVCRWATQNNMTPRDAMRHKTTNTSRGVNKADNIERSYIYYVHTFITATCHFYVTCPNASFNFQREQLATMLILLINFTTIYVTFLYVIPVISTYCFVLLLYTLFYQFFKYKINGISLIVSLIKIDTFSTWRITRNILSPARFFSSWTLHCPLLRSSANNSGYLETSSSPRGTLWMIPPCTYENNICFVLLLFMYILRITFFKIAL